MYSMETCVLLKPRYMHTYDIHYLLNWWKSDRKLLLKLANATTLTLEQENLAILKLLLFHRSELMKPLPSLPNAIPRILHIKLASNSFLMNAVLVRIDVKDVRPSYFTFEHELQQIYANTSYFQLLYLRILHFVTLKFTFAKRSRNGC